MTFAADKVTTLPEFMGQVRGRIESAGQVGALVYFDHFLESELQRKLVDSQSVSPEWDGSVNAGDFDTIYPFAANMLHQSASVMFDEVHRDSYQRADEVSRAFCDQLNETFERTEEDAYKHLEIKSWVQIAEEEGVITVDEDDMVRLTPEGEQMAATFRRGVER